MAEAKRITIKSREVTGPHTKKDGKGTYSLHKITTTDGEEFSLFGQTDSVNPTVNRKEILGLDAGAEVQMISERNGKFLKVLDLAVVGQANLESTTQPEPKATKTTAPWKTTKAPTAQLVHTSKDLEISILAIMKSLLEGAGGHYHTVKQTEQGTQTYINDKLLEAHVNRILDLKDIITQSRQK